MEYRRPIDGPPPHSRLPPPLPPSMASPPGLARPLPPPRPILPSSLPSLSTGQGFYTVESLQNATVVPPPRLLPPPEPFHQPPPPLDRFDPPVPPPRPRSHFPDDRAFPPPPLPHPSRLDRGPPPHRDLPPRDVGPMVRGGPRMRQPPPSFFMDPRMPGFHAGRGGRGRGRGWGPSREFGLGRRMDRGRAMQSLGVRKQLQKSKSISQSNSSLPAPTADKKSPAKNQEQVQGGPGWCSVCEVNCIRPETLTKHLAGKRHKRQLEKLNGEPEEANKEGEGMDDESEEMKKLDGEDKVMEEEDAGDVDEPEKKEVNEEDLEVVIEGKENEQVEAAAISKAVTPTAAKKRPNRDKDGGSATKKRQKAVAASDTQNETAGDGGESEDKRADNENSRKAEKVVDAVEVCQLCNVTCNSKAILETHLKGKKHAARLKKAASNSNSKSVTGEGTGIAAADDLANGNAGQ